MSYEDPSNIGTPSVIRADFLQVHGIDIYAARPGDALLKAMTAVSTPRGGKSQQGEFPAMRQIHIVNVVDPFDEVNPRP